MASEQFDEFKRAIYNLIAGLDYGDEYDSFRWSQFTEHIVFFAYEYGYQVGLTAGYKIKDEKDEEEEKPKAVKK